MKDLPFAGASRARLLAMGPAAMGSVAFGLLLPAATAQLTAVERPIFFDPVNAVPLDYDGDGVEEILRASPSGSTLDAYVLSPAGEFVIERSLAEVTNSPQEVVLGDVDGDGAADLITLESEPAGWRIRAYLNRGAAQYEPTASIGLAEIGDRVIATDLDGDGNEDLLLYPAPRDLPSGETSQPARTVRWVQNLGGGSFASPSILSPLPDALVSARPVDMDLDGDVDFVGITGSTNSLVLLRSSGLAYQVSPLPLGTVGYLDVEVGDLNGDGFLDVAALRPDVAQGFDFTVDIFRGSAAGTFGNAAPLPGAFSDFYSDLALLDVNGDSELEIAVAIENPVRREHLSLVWFNDGQGSFLNRRFTGIVPDEPLTQVAVGDFNGDGRDDLFGAVLNQEDPTIQASPLLAVRLGAGGVLSPTAIEDAILTNLRVPDISTAAADLDGDGVQDVITSYGEDLVWARGQSDGSGFEAPRTLGALGELVFAANLDGDGAAELVVRPAGGAGLAVIDNDGSGTLGAAQPVTQNDATFQLSRNLVDLDADGDLDLIGSVPGSAPSWVENLGGLNFAAPVPVSFGSPIGTELFDVGDFNGDGVVDVLSRQLQIFPFIESLSWFEGLGGAVFGPRQVVGLAGDKAIVVDANADGADDVLWANAESGQVGWTPGGPQGLLVGDGFTLVATAPARSLIGLADYNGDGDSDILVTSFDGQVLGFAGVSVAGSIFFTPNAFEVVPAFGVVDPLVLDQVAQLTDLGSDGDLDLLMHSALSPVAWYQNEANGLVGDAYCGPAVPNSTGASASMLAVGSAAVQEGNLSLRAADLPPSTFGFFIVSQTQVAATPVIASAGRICLGGSVGRYVGSGQVQNSGLAGSIGLEIDLAAIPTPNGFVAAAPGSTWSFQAWFRDTSAGGPTSNFTDGLGIDVR